MRNKVKILNWRFFLICACISFSILAVIYKVFSIQIKESNFLQNEGNKRYVKYKIFHLYEEVYLIRITFRWQLL